jgi:hypothetical protein
MRNTKSHVRKHCGPCTIPSRMKKRGFVQRLEHVLEDALDRGHAPDLVERVLEPGILGVQRAQLRQVGARQALETLDDALHPLVVEAAVHGGPHRPVDRRTAGKYRP